MKDLEENAKYSGFTENSSVIKWLWEVLNEFNETWKANFLFFLTGTINLNILFEETLIIIHYLSINL